MRKEELLQVFDRQEKAKVIVKSKDKKIWTYFKKKVKPYETIYTALIVHKLVGTQIEISAACFVEKEFDKMCKYFELDKNLTELRMQDLRPNLGIPVLVSRKIYPVYMKLKYGK